MEIIKATTKYIPLIANEEYTENNLCVEIGYSLGGRNWFTEKNEARGYYLICTPVRREEHRLDNGRTYTTITNTIGNGRKLLLKEVTRKSKKAQAEAAASAEKQEKWLVAQVCALYGLKLAKGQTIKFYSPLKARLDYPSRDDDESCDEATFHDAMDYLGYINRYIIEDITENESSTLGLLHYADDGMLELFQKHIQSFSVAVEVGELNGQQGIPMLVYSCELLPGLLPATVKELSDAIAEVLEGQYSDGWGEALEQKPIRIDTNCDLYIKLWDSGFEFAKIEII